MGQRLNAFSRLMYALSRIPGLGFLYDVSNTTRQVGYEADRAKRAKDDLDTAVGKK